MYVFVCTCMVFYISADSDSLHLLLEKDIVGVVVKMMQELPSHSSAQQVHAYNNNISRGICTSIVSVC